MELSVQVHAPHWVGPRVGLQPLLGTIALFLGRSVCSLVTVLTELSRLLHGENILGDFCHINSLAS
jgi:hypothetical protein